MKPILFIATMTGLIYAADRWDWLGLTAAGIFAAGSLALIYIAAFNYLRRSRLL